MATSTRSKTGTSSRSRKTAAKKSAPSRSAKRKTAAKKTTARSGGKKKSATSEEASEFFVPPEEPTKPETAARVTEAEIAAAELRQKLADAEKAEKDALQAERGEILESMKTATNHHTTETKTMQEQFEAEREAATAAHTQAIADKRQSHDSVMEKYRERLDAVNAKLGIKEAPSAPARKNPSAAAPELPPGSNIDPALWARLTQPVDYEIVSLREAVLTVHHNAGDDPVPAAALRYACAHFSDFDYEDADSAGKKAQVSNACGTLRDQKLISKRGCERGCNKITSPGKKQVEAWIKEASEYEGDDPGEIAQSTASRAAAPPPSAQSNGSPRAGRKNPLGGSDRYIVLACHRAGEELGRSDLATGVLDLKYVTNVQDPDTFRNSLQAGIRRAVEAKEIKVNKDGRVSFYSVTAKGKKEGQKLDREAKKIGV